MHVFFDLCIHHTQLAFVALPGIFPLVLAKMFYASRVANRIEDIVQCFCSRVAPIDARFANTHNVHSATAVVQHRSEVPLEIM